MAYMVSSNLTFYGFKSHQQYQNMFKQMEVYAQLAKATVCKTVTLETS